MGKIFRFQNIISAWIKKDPSDDNMKKYSKDQNVTFYINSLHPKVLAEVLSSSTVVFVISTTTSVL